MSNDIIQFIRQCYVPINSVKGNRIRAFLIHKSTCWKIALMKFEG